MTSLCSDVVVVGAGIIGAAIARRLAERDVRVAVVEANRPGGGTTLATFSWVNAVGKTPRPYFDLNMEGVAEHRRLIDEFGDDDWYHDGGNLEWSLDGANLEVKVAAHREWGYAVELIDVAAARSLEPDVAVDEAARVALYPDDGWVDPVMLVRRLLDHPGVELLAPVEVSGIVVDGGRVSGVKLDDGRRLSADAVIIATGPRAAELVRTVGLDLPMQDGPGLLALTEPAPVRVGRILHLPGLAVRPDGAGRLLIASDGLDKRIEPSGGEMSLIEALDELLRRAIVAIPRLAGVRIESSRIGQRALTADGMPAIGPVPGCDGAYLAVTHSGVTLAPLIGRLVADELAGGQRDPRLDDYLPDRFVAPTPAD